MLASMTWSEHKDDVPREDARTHLERMRAGDWFKYRAGPELAHLQMNTKRGCVAASERYWDDPAAATHQLRALLLECGPGFDWRPPFFVEYGERVRIGADVFVNRDLVVIGGGMVTIGDRALIGPGVRLYTPNHAKDLALRREGWEIGLPISIGADAWLGGSVVVCPGVTIGENAIVAAGSVVTRDVPDGKTVGGNPARVIG